MKTKILKHFVEKFPGWVYMMNNTSHHSEDYTSSYHLEGDVWAHTMMVYNQADETDPIELILALCHDIGKCMTRDIKDDGKVTFYGHPEASVQYAIDFIVSLYEHNIIDSTEFLYCERIVPTVISNHMLYYQNPNRIGEISSDSISMAEYFQVMADMDIKGSISKSDKLNKEYNFETCERPIDNCQPTVNIWCGVPGSGKDYLAALNGYPIISWDDIRVGYFVKNSDVDTTEMSSNEIYTKAFQYCNDNKVNLMDIMTKIARKYLDKNQNINICNTSLSRKSRRKIINSIGSKFNYNVTLVLAPTTLCMTRNLNRSSKTISEDVIRNMMRRIEVPTFFEKHINEVYTIINI